MFRRSCKPSESNSFFLFGARGTGKTTLLSQSDFLSDSVKIDLLDPEEESRFILYPNQLQEVARGLSPGSWILIDEVQKVPKLLDLVHKIIEEQKIRFALTGSSARKLKRGGANLLAGRAFVFHLFPLTSSEIGKNFDLTAALSWGTLPKLFDYQNDVDRARFLSTYVHTYVKEEIQVEQLIRKLEPFRLFLQVAAQMNGEIINYSNIAKDTGVDIKSVQNYFQILCDTYLGSFLEPYMKSVRKVQRQSPKFYFFDTGVKRALEGKIRVPLQSKTSEFGNAFESWFINECWRRNSYLENDYKMSYLRTKDDVEIDLIVERPGQSELLVEIKSTEKVDDRHIRNLEHFAKDFPNSVLICACREPRPRQVGRIKILPWHLAILEVTGSQ